MIVVTSTEILAGSGRLPRPPRTDAAPNENTLSDWPERVRVLNT